MPYQLNISIDSVGLGTIYNSSQEVTLAKSMWRQRRRGNNHKTPRHLTFERDRAIVGVSGRSRFWRNPGREDAQETASMIGI